MTNGITHWTCQCGVQVPFGCSHSCAHIGARPEVIYCDHEPFRQRIEQLESEAAALRQEIERLRAALALADSGAAEIERLRRINMEPCSLVNEVAALRQEIERLRGALIDIRDNNFLATDPATGKARAYSPREIADAALATQDTPNG